MVHMADPDAHSGAVVLVHIIVVANDRAVVMSMTILFILTCGFVATAVLMCRVFKVVLHVDDGKGSFGLVCRLHYSW